MSAFTFSQNQQLNKKLTADFWDTRPFWGDLKRNGRIITGDAGNAITIDYRTNPADGYSFGKGATFTATEKGDYVRASYGWAGYAHDDIVYGWELRQQGAEGRLDTGTIRNILTLKADSIKEDFYQGFSNQLWQGNGTPLNGGNGVSLNGVEIYVTATPSSGTVGGINRATYTRITNKQVTGTSGPSSSWILDCWERLLTTKYECRFGTKKGVPMMPDLVYIHPTEVVDIQNLGYAQNTNVDVNVGEVQSIAGMRWSFNDVMDANQVYLLNSKTWSFHTCNSKDEMMQVEFRDNLENQIDKMDTVVLMKCGPAQLVCDWPAANGVITSAG